MYFKTFNIPAAASVPVLCILLFTACRQYSASAPWETATLKPSVQGRDGIIADYRYLSDPGYTLSLEPSILETVRTNWCLKSDNVWVPVMGSISTSGKKQGCGLAGNAGFQYLKGYGIAPWNSFAIG